MDVDHFNPHLSKDVRNRYTNLYLATRHCNGSKHDKWPTMEQLKRDMRFLDPCAETDYGVHIFEDPDTFRVWGKTPAGRYHIRGVDLNAEHLIAERRKRHQLRQHLKSESFARFVCVPGEELTALQGVKAMIEEVEQMIHPIAQEKEPPLKP